MCSSKVRIPWFQVKFSNVAKNEGVERSDFRFDNERSLDGRNMERRFGSNYTANCLASNDTAPSEMSIKVNPDDKHPKVRSHSLKNECST